METWSFDSPDPEATHAIARELGRAIGATGLVIGLVGPLGAGKTVFVKGLAEGLGIAPAAVSSPTFVIAQQYPLPLDASPKPEWLHHVDLYRLESEDELEAMGFSDLFESGAVLAVEWSDRFPGVLGPERLDIVLDGPALQADSGRGRHARVDAHGTLAELALQDWKERTRNLVEGGGGGPGASAVGGGGAAARNPRQRLLWMLVVAIALAGFARLDPASTSAACDHPEALVDDALGTLRVECSEQVAVTRAPTGIGGLLFGRPLDLGSVTERQLESLPGIGPSRAQAIVAERERRAFERVSDLQRVHGIGPRTVERLSSWLMVPPPTPTKTPKKSSRETTGGHDRG